MNSQKIDSEENCDDLVFDMVFNKYKSGTEYSVQLSGESSVPLKANTFRDQFTTLMRVVQHDFFNPDRPRETGVFFESHSFSYE